MATSREIPIVNWVQSELFLVQVLLHHLPFRNLSLKYCYNLNFSENGSIKLLKEKVCVIHMSEKVFYSSFMESFGKFEPTIIYKVSEILKHFLGKVLDSREALGSLSEDVQSRFIEKYIESNLILDFKNNFSDVVACLENYLKKVVLRVISSNLTLLEHENIELLVMNQVLQEVDPETLKPICASQYELSSMPVRYRVRNEPKLKESPHQEVKDTVVPVAVNQPLTSALNDESKLSTQLTPTFYSPSRQSVLDSSANRMTHLVTEESPAGVRALELPSINVLASSSSSTAQVTALLAPTASAATSTSVTTAAPMPTEWEKELKEYYYAASDSKEAPSVESSVDWTIEFKQSMVPPARDCPSIDMGDSVAIEFNADVGQKLKDSIGADEKDDGHQADTVFASTAGFLSDRPQRALDMSRTIENQVRAVSMRYKVHSRL